jgi:hypothetical protein
MGEMWGQLTPEEKVYYAYMLIEVSKITTIIRIIRINLAIWVVRVSRLLRVTHRHTTYRPMMCDTQAHYEQTAAEDKARYLRVCLHDGA